MPTREPTADEVSALIDNGTILNEPGADLLTRWLVKTFSANPEEAKKFLERRGFEVRETGNVFKMQFAIRNKAVSEVVGGEANNPWKVLDPKGFDLGDIADIAFDVFIAGPIVAQSTVGGAAVGAGLSSGTGPGAFLGAGAGAAVGGGLSGAGVEAGRQSIGALLGVNEEPDIGRVLSGGLLSAVLPGLGARLARFPRQLLQLAKFANKKAASIVTSMGSLVSGAKEESLVTAASSAQRASRVLQQTQSEPIQLLDRMRGVIQGLRSQENPFPESVEIDKILLNARPVTLRGVFQKLREVDVGPIGDQKVGIRRSGSLADDIAKRFGFKSAEDAIAADVSTSGGIRISAKEAQRLRRDLDDLIDFSGRPGQSLANKRMKAARFDLKQRLARSPNTAAARAEYRKLIGKPSRTTEGGKFVPGTGVAGKTEVINELEKKLGEHQGGDAAEQFLQRIAKPHSRTQEARLVEQFDKHFKTNFIEEGKIANVAKQFARDVPRITTTGQFLGLSAGTALGLKLGGVPGAIAGTAAAFEALSPRGIVRAQRVVQVTERSVRGAIGTLGSAQRKVEPLTEFLGRAGGGAASSPAAQAAGEVFAPAPKTPEVRATVQDLVDQFNALPGMERRQQEEQWKARINAAIEQEQATAAGQ